MVFRLCRRLWRTYKINVGSRSSGPVLCNTRKFFAKARKFLTKARKFQAKFDVFRLKHYLLKPRFDMNASLQVEIAVMHDWLAFGPDLQNRDHVKFFN